MARILLIHQPVDGGVGRHVSDLARGLHKGGHEVILCGPGLPTGVPAGCRHVALALERAVAPRSDAAALRRVEALVRGLAPDLIHVHSSKAGAIARLARSLHPRVPLVYSPHGYAFAGYFERDLERSAYRLIERGLAPLASRVIAVCEAEARLARAVGPRGRVRVIYNGVTVPLEPVEVDPRMRELKAAGPVICTLTQLRPGKGMETLLDAMPAMLAAHPRAQLAVWGDGPDRPALTARAQTLGIGASVHFLGSTEQPLSIMAGADVFTFPSLAEAFPYVILEAMSMACAIVASDVGGIGEALGDGTGLRVPAAHPAKFAAAVTSLLSDPQRARALGVAARQRLDQMFAVQKMLDETMELYSELVPAFLPSAQAGP